MFEQAVAAHSVKDNETALAKQLHLQQKGWRWARSDAVAGQRGASTCRPGLERLDGREISACARRVEGCVRRHGALGWPCKCASCASQEKPPLAGRGWRRPASSNALAAWVCARSRRRRQGSSPGGEAACTRPG